MQPGLHLPEFGTSKAGSAKRTPGEAPALEFAAGRHQRHRREQRHDALRQEGVCGSHDRDQIAGSPVAGDCVAGGRADQRRDAFGYKRGSDRLPMPELGAHQQ